MHRTDDIPMSNKKPQSVRNTVSCTSASCSTVCKLGAKSFYWTRMYFIEPWNNTCLASRLICNSINTMISIQNRACWVSYC